MHRDESRGAINVLARRAQLASVLLLGCMSLAVAADRATELSDEFLEYLGTVEGDDDNWLEVMASATSAAAQPTDKSDAKTEAKTVSASSSSASSKAVTQAASVATSAAPKADKVDK